MNKIIFVCAAAFLFVSCEIVSFDKRKKVVSFEVVSRNKVSDKRKKQDKQVRYLAKKREKSLAVLAAQAIRIPQSAAVVEKTREEILWECIRVAQRDLCFAGLLLPRRALTMRLKDSGGTVQQLSTREVQEAAMAVMRRLDAQKDEEQEAIRLYRAQALEKAIEKDTADIYAKEGRQRPGSVPSVNPENSEDDKILNELKTQFDSFAAKEVASEEDSDQSGDVVYPNYDNVFDGYDPKTPVN